MRGSDIMIIIIFLLVRYLYA